ncbi:putative zn-finger domain-containing protein [Lyophyllum shimeji]|uniref:Zn-finger domain-containing protein n=1 Tax=Lyophyllum shimeji TaxID=47721 RepID=A0A9P3PMR0_LYOSH|nr:putative zn-finger domain-containing protein [Lyophyllum shimeji]
MPGYEAKPARSRHSDEGEDEEEETDDGDDDKDDDEDDTTPRPQNQAVYSVAKKPALPRVTIPSIAQDFGAGDFLTHLTTFLRERSITASIPSSPTFPVYNRLHLTLPPIPEVSTTPIKDAIVATKSERGHVTTHGIRKAKPARFSTILVRVPAGDRSKGPVDGLRVAQVRLIFRLSEDPSSFREPLLYVHWFKPLGTFNNDLGMYQTSFSTRNHQQRAGIITASEVFASCHLIPRFGRAVDPTWEPHSVFNHSPSFYLNPYLRHFDFYNLRYLLDLHRFRNHPRHGVVRRQHLQLVQNARYRPP